MSIGECLKITSNYKDGQSISEISNRVNRSWKTVNDFIKQLNQSLASDMLLDMAENTKRDANGLFKGRLQYFKRYKIISFMVLIISIIDL